MSSIRNELDYINTMAKSDPLRMIGESETRYRNIVSDIAKKASVTSGHKLLLLAGPSASGKTTTAHKLAENMEQQGIKAHRISLDDFYLEVGAMRHVPGAVDLESVYALDLPLLRDTLRSLMETGSGEIPHFKFSVGKRTRRDTLTIGKDDMIVLEGLHALHGEITEQLPVLPRAVTKVYISVSSRIYDGRDIILNKRNMRLVRRILRDHQFRGSNAQHTISMWPSVTQGEERWLSPCKPNADFLINSIHIYESCLFAPRVLPLLETVPTNSPEAGEATRLAKSLRRFEHLDENLVPPDSLLREFLGNA